MRYVFIGGMSFDKQAVAGYLGALPPGSRVVAGSGRGLEKFVLEQAPELQLEKTQLVNPYNQAEEVEALCAQALGETLVLGAANSVRVKDARSFLKRANWPITVVEL